MALYLLCYNFQIVWIICTTWEYFAPCCAFENSVLIFYEAARNSERMRVHVCTPWENSVWINFELYLRIFCSLQCLWNFSLNFLGGCKKFWKDARASLHPLRKFSLNFQRGCEDVCAPLHPYTCRPRIDAEVFAYFLNNKCGTIRFEFGNFTAPPRLSCLSKTRTLPLLWPFENKVYPHFEKQ